MAGYPFARPADSILDLPDDLLFSVCQFLPLTDLVNIRLVCSVFKDVVDSPRHVALWARAPLADLWPDSASSYSMGIITRAAKSGNVEAMLKLAVAYLYCEGVPECAGKGTLDSVNGVMATEWLLKAEKCCEHWQPFIWVLIRPPWSPHGVCCKACVHLKLKELVDRGQGEFLPRSPYLIGKTLSFHEDSQKDEALAYYRKGMERECPFSTYEYLKLHQPTLTSMDVSGMRLLRASASLSRPLHCWPAQLDLCHAYAAGNFGGISEVVGLDFVRQLLQMSKSSYSSKLQKGITTNMRYILVDWLFEVAEMKEFPPETVHLAVNLVDRFLQLREVKRTKLQLVGISAILLAARWMGPLIITIREAAWLTDNTYKYEQVVRMMGEVLAVFRGDLRRPTLVDYVDIILKFAKVPMLTCNVALYLSEFALLHLHFLTLKPSHMAAAIVLLATIIADENKLNTWPQALINITGCTTADLAPLCIELHAKCFVDEWTVKDHRNIELKAVKHRFSVSRFMEVSKMEVMSLNELKTHLGLYSEDEMHMSCVFENVTSSDSTTVVSVANLSISETNSPAFTADSMMDSGRKTEEAEQVSDSDRDYTPCGEMDHSTSVGKGLSGVDSPSLRAPPPGGEGLRVVDPNSALAPFHHNRPPLQNIANQQRNILPGGVKHSHSAALKGGEYTRRVHAATDTSQTKSKAN